jgi:hypothetical protein
MPPELREKLDGLLREYIDARTKADRLRARCRSITERLRVGIKDVVTRYHGRAGVRERRQREAAAEFLRLWDELLPGRGCVSLPTAVAYPRTECQVEVRDKRVVIEALDRLDRLDLVDYVIDERRLTSLARKGLLKDVPESALVVRTGRAIRVLARKDEGDGSDQ